jgi:hypothetical protein
MTENQKRDVVLQSTLFIYLKLPKFACPVNSATPKVRREQLQVSSLIDSNRSAANSFHEVKQNPKSQPEGDHGLS